MIEHPSEYGLALDGSDLRRQTDGNRVILCVQRPVAQALMRSQTIVVIGVSLDNMIEVFQSKTQEVFMSPIAGNDLAQGRAMMLLRFHQCVLGLELLRLIYLERADGFRVIASVMSVGRLSDRTVCYELAVKG